MTADNKDESSIDELSMGLYSRNASQRLSEEAPELTHKEYAVPEQWQGEEKIQEKSFNGKNLLKKVLWASVAFFVLALLVAGYMFLSGFGAFSSNNIEIEITGPNNINGGEELVLDLSITNRNKSALENVVLTVEYPQGTLASLETGESLVKEVEEIGNISAGSEANKRLRAVMFGEVNTARSIRFEIEYGFANSESRFSKEEIYDVAIASAPVVISAGYPQEVNPIQDIEMEIVVSSNSNQILHDLLVVADYPFGFDFESANPSPVYENNVWRIGDLQPNEERTIELAGRITGQVNEEKTFRFNIGMEDDANPNSIGVNFISSVESIRIGQPFMDLRLSIGGESQSEHVVSAGRTVNASISWENNVGAPVNDVEIEAFLEGGIFDRASVRVSNGGFFRSIDNTVIWNRNLLSSLSQVNPGEEGSVSFSFDILSVSSMDLFQIMSNPSMSIEARISGTRVAGSRPQETLSSFVISDVKLATGAQLNARAVYSTGPFANFGPMPPKAEQSTTYTVIWNASSNISDMENVEVRATLPTYVDWMDNVSPGNENVLYNPSDRSVTWSVGEVKAGMGFVTSPREVAFQVSFLPSLSQLNSTPVIVNEALLRGGDSFSGIVLEHSRPALTTRLSTDPLYSASQYGRVTQ